MQYSSYSDKDDGAQCQTFSHKCCLISTTNVVATIVWNSGIRILPCHGQNMRRDDFASVSFFQGKNTCKSANFHKRS